MRYAYKARQVESNSIIKGIGEYDNEEDLKRELARENRVPISIKVINKIEVKYRAFFDKPIKMVDLVRVIRQLSVMVGAGISVGRALEMSGKECKNKQVQSKINMIYKQVSMGKSLADAIKKSKLLPEVVNSMLEAAEASGQIHHVLNQIVDYLEKQLEIKNKIKKAMIYPSLIMMTLLGAIVLLITSVIPSYVTIFEQMTIELPISTQIVMVLGEGILEYGTLILLIVIGSGLLINKLSTTKRGKYYKDRIILSMPLIGRMHKEVLTVRWSECMALLLTSGIPILQALEVSKKVLNNSVAEIELENMLIDIRQGWSLYEALKKSTIYPEFLTSMIGVGEESGTLDEMLGEVAKYFNTRLKEMIDKMIIMIEPTFTIIIAIVVGFIMISILMPTFALAGNIL